MKTSTPNVSEKCYYNRNLWCFGTDSPVYYIRSNSVDENEDGGVGGEKQDRERAGHSLLHTFVQPLVFKVDEILS